MFRVSPLGLIGRGSRTNASSVEIDARVARNVRGRRCRVATLKKVRGDVRDCAGPRAVTPDVVRHPSTQEGTQDRAHSARDEDVVRIADDLDSVGPAAPAEGRDEKSCRRARCADDYRILGVGRSPRGPAQGRILSQVSPGPEGSTAAARATRSGRRRAPRFAVRPERLAPAPERALHRTLPGIAARIRSRPTPRSSSSRPASCRNGIRLQQGLSSLFTVFHDVAAGAPARDRGVVAPFNRSSRGQSPLSIRDSSPASNSIIARACARSGTEPRP